ncbi:hypothetical protein [Periweissella ghanensis]|uniref:Uncharacterized protein n=1 Tax=Periweissella ghanensis TaxID=467997 RepID=A0ABN8BNA5_9LACO|nr:hypothetical protein [Periweissella ghanensis]MCM0600952.1 hypothetical protein [Periweissella ghanensis]CAH0417630.1 hypothetical protein WGH24286_00042 [Periweissella ghanensis]
MNQVTFIIIAIILILLEEFVLANNRYFWLGAILPVLTILGLVLIWHNTAIHTWYDYVMLPLCLLFIIYAWGYGRSFYHKRKNRKLRALQIHNQYQQKTGLR